MDDVYTTFHKLHKFLQSQDHADKMEMHNDDLIGFYTSVPQERILRATTHLLATYIDLQPGRQGNIQFTVDIKQKESTQRVFRGRTRSHSCNTYVIGIQDLQEMIQLSFQMSDFVFMGIV